MNVTARRPIGPIGVIASWNTPFMLSTWKIAPALNDPVTGIVWLARRMGQYGQRIEAGQVILSGAFIAPTECPARTAIAADFGPFGQVAIDFE